MNNRQKIENYLNSKGIKFDELRYIGADIAEFLRNGQPLRPQPKGVYYAEIGYQDEQPPKFKFLVYPNKVEIRNNTDKLIGNL